MSKGYFTWLFFLISLYIFGQTVNTKEFSGYMSNGEKYFKTDEYFLAMQEYNKALKINPQDPQANYMYAEASRNNADFEEAERFYDLAYRKAAKTYPLALFWFGVMQKYNEKYHESAITLQKFIKGFVPVTENDKAMLAIANKELLGSQKAIEVYGKPIKDHNLQVLPPPVNSRNTDYAPMIFLNDTSIFVSSARADAKGKDLNQSSGESKCDNFRFEKKGDKWIRTIKNDNFDLINTEFEDGAGELNKRRDKYYFTICSPECGIYVAKLVDGKFIKPERLNDNVSPHYSWNAQPTLSPSGDSMIFVSTREGGKGAQDLWMSVNKDKSGANEDWGTAVNMAAWNSPETEISPFWDDVTNKIYFASNGHVGYGGLDVYVTSGKGRSQFSNLGPPFNSSRDDIYFVIGDQKGYIVSNRKGGIGLTDIYIFDRKAKEGILSKLVKGKFPPGIKLNGQGRVIYSDVQEPVNGVTIYLKDLNGNIIDNAVTDSNGEFKFYDISSDNEVYIAMEENDPRFAASIEFVSKDGSGQETTKLVSLNAALTPDGKPTGKESSIQTETTSASNETASQVNLPVDQQVNNYSKSKTGNPIFENIYYEFNSADIPPSGKIVLDKLVEFYKEQPEINIEIKAYTDNFGNVNYNKQLAEERGKACYDYLIRHGVNAKAITIFPAGSDRPIGNNNSFVGRQLNRRVEFSISNSQIDYISDAMAYIVEPKETGHIIAKKFNMTLDELKAFNGTETVFFKAYSVIRVKRSLDAKIIAPATLTSLRTNKLEYKFQNSHFVPVE